MPELPEVETMVRGIRPFVEGRRLIAFRKCPCHCRPMSMQPSAKQMAARAEGETVVAAKRRAKRIVLELGSGDAFVIEPRMTGLMLLSDPPSVEHLRLEWEFEPSQTYNSVWFWDRRGLGTVRLYTAAEMAQHLGPDRLGPDALEMTVDDWVAGCRATSRAIKVLLLPKDTNNLGTIFGGVILSHIDLASAVEARKVAPHRYVTKAMHEVEFHSPVFVGDIVNFYTETVKIGRTSVTVKVTVMVERWSAGAGETELVTEAEVVLVAIGQHGRPIPVRPDQAGAR